MPIKVTSVTISVASISALFATLITHSCDAATLRVSVVDPAGKPVPNMVVVLTPTSSISAPAVNAQAVMDQIDKTFVPEVLVVRTGTAVIFPNSDAIAHQVYSFSTAKRFALPLYRGRPYPPVVFDQPGIATLGCNIHDRMVGYIYVTDSPYFGKTDKQGHVELRLLSPTTYQVAVWSPYLTAAEPDRPVVVADSDDVELTLHLAHRPREASSSSTDHRIRDY